MARRGDAILGLCLIIFCCPIISPLIARKYYCSCKDARAREKRQVLPPKPLPYSRNNLSRDSIQNNITTLSSLLQLPYDIRMKIYSHLFSDHTFHIVHLRKRLAHVQCTVPHLPDSTFHPCFPGRIYSRREHACVKYTGQTSHLDTALLYTCKQIYTEAMPLLYASNTFSLYNLDSLVYLSQRIRPHRLASIRHLKLCWDMDAPPVTYPQLQFRPFDIGTWIRFWSIVVQRMPGLESLILTLGTMARPDLSEMEKMWLAPLLDVRGLKTFQLRISYERAFPGEDEPKVTKEMANFRKKIAKTVRKPRVETRRLVESGDPEDGVQVTYCECCGGVESMYDKSNGARWEQDVRMHGEELGCMAATDVI